jgi:hypothetical protein
MMIGPAPRRRRTRLQWWPRCAPRCTLWSRRTRGWRCRTCGRRAPRTRQVGGGPGSGGGGDAGLSASGSGSELAAPGPASPCRSLACASPQDRPAAMRPGSRCVPNGLQHPTPACHPRRRRQLRGARGARAAGRAAGGGHRGRCSLQGRGRAHRCVRATSTRPPAARQLQLGLQAGAVAVRPRSGPATLRTGLLLACWPQQQPGDTPLRCCRPRPAPRRAPAAPDSGPVAAAHPAQPQRRQPQGCGGPAEEEAGRGQGGRRALVHGAWAQAGQGGLPCPAGALQRLVGARLHSP